MKWTLSEVRQGCGGQPAVGSSRAGGLGWWASCILAVSTKSRVLNVPASSSHWASRHQSVGRKMCRCAFSVCKDKWNCSDKFIFLPRIKVYLHVCDEVSTGKGLNGKALTLFRCCEKEVEVSGKWALLTLSEFPNAKREISGDSVSLADYTRCNSFKIWKVIFILKYCFCESSYFYLQFSFYFTN